MLPEESSLLFSALQRAMRQSSFWRSRFLDINVQETDLREGFPFHELPPITKQDLLEDQAASPPFGTLLAVSPTEIRRIHRTSGTSSTPLFVALTERDITDTYIASERAFHLAGVGAGERVAHCLNFNMWSGGVTDYIPLERLHATAVPFGAGNTSLLLRLIRSLGINAISSTPSYMFTIADRCRIELGIEPRELGLRRGYFGGEGLLQVPGVREFIETTFGMTAVDANYGMSEVLSIIAGEGPERNGLVNHTHGILYMELLTPSGESIPIQSGAVGELVFSSLRREAQPLFRYRTNDLAEIVWTEMGEDGLMRCRFHIRGRTDQMLVIKGVNFFPQSLMSVLSEFDGHVSQRFCVIRPKPESHDSVDVVIERHLAGLESDDLASRIEKRVSALLQIRIRIIWAPNGCLSEDGNKARYLVDDISDIPGLGSFATRGRD